MENNKEEARKWINNGGLCTYRYGLAFRGAGARKITKEEALEKIDKKGWSFGMSFYELSWTEFNGEKCLEFNELGENDLY